MKKNFSLVAVPLCLLSLLDARVGNYLIAGLLFVASAVLGLFYLLARLAKTDATDSTVQSEDRAAADSGADTEFACEVVKIRELKPHGNADRLEIALLDFARTGAAAYEVVVRKGEYQIGDLAVYVSVDSLVPLTRPEFAFLKQPDSKRDVHRVKAARLRGVYSQGLLVPPPRGAAFGDRVAEQLGVTYYNPDPEDAASDKRDRHLERGASKPKAQPMPVYGVASLKKSPEMFKAGDDVVISEKLHGSNSRAGWVRVPRFFGLFSSWQFLVGSHRVIKGQAKGNHFYKEDIWLAAAEHLHLAEKLALCKGTVIYGELYGYAGQKKIQDLTYGRPPGAAGFVVFDARDLKNDRWLPYQDLVELCARLDLPMAPLLYRGPYREGLAEELAEGKSTVIGAGEQIREGCVVGSEDGTRKAKYVGKGYLLRGEEKSEATPKKAKRAQGERAA